MRTLGEIIESAKDGFEPTKDELLYALLAMSALHHFDHRHIMETVTHPNWVSDDWSRQMWADESFNRFKLALNTDPQTWLGWGNDPKNPDYQKMRRAASKLLDKVMKEQKEQVTPQEEGK